MIAAISAILGFLSTVAPLAIQYFSLKENNAQTIRLETLRQQGEREKVAGQVDIANVQADIEQGKHIYDFGSGASGYKFIDAFAVSIRPYVTWVFFHFYLLMKAALFVYGVNKGFDLGQLVKLLWDETDSALFGAIMGFWFGNRVIMRSQQMAATQAIMQRNNS
jgi:hypothetical protein